MKHKEERTMEENRNMTMMITVDDGSRKIPIMNKEGEEIGAFTFRPTDVGIVARFNAMAEGFDAITEPLDAIADVGDGEIDLSDPKNAEALDEATRRLYDAVNGLLNSDGAAAAFFGKMNPFSPVDGEFYCTRVLNAVGAYIGAAFETETTRFSDKAKKYAKKATRK